ncbi:unnamed protein product [Aspergillus oryzae var. brunneus]|uniref:Unnamed protein product n=1 Tax=Aspergillus oryzae var. brunneus TaxID=332754 RepID=A0ABQ6L337_ASPOZ|nr:unnamed protein product [Aspergillus oryzae var. brunneus]
MSASKALRKVGIWIPRRLCLLLTATQHLSPVVTGRSTSSYPTNTPTRALVSGSSGSVCLDVINQTWSPMYDMINIFEVFLPQLLRYPNPSDPLNGEAAAMLMREPKSYEAKVKGRLSTKTLDMHYILIITEYVAKYASKEAVDDDGEDTESEDELSSAGSYESGGEEPAGTMDDV